MLQHRHASTDPSVYIADLADYNAGNLRGFWLDPVGKDADEISEEIAEFLAKVPGHEEWAVHDYDGFPNLGEYPGAERIADIAEIFNEHDDFAVIKAYVDHVGAHYATANGFRDAFQGVFESAEQYAEDFLESTGMLRELPDWAQPYFDMERYARNLELGGDVFFADISGGVAVFDNH